jgi:LuxR family transcriptional regulator, maltose regulon positive regulatory protein
LEDHTEGWIAGLQLAALSMQGRQDIPEFIQAFTGDHRYIMDYLVEEVLQHQTETTRSFLLQTAILGQLTGSLCDAVTGQADSSARLEALQRRNFFVVPLDDKRKWYRYHHLFAEVLHTYLMEEQPEQIATLHRRASAWFEQHGQAADAIRHALDAEDFAHAADLVERAFPDMARTRQEATMLGWLKALPEPLVRERPVLCNLYAGVLLQHGLMENVDAWLRAAEMGLDPAAEKTFVNEAEFRRLPGRISIHRAGLALMLGHVTDTIKYAQKAIELAPEEDYLMRGGAAGLLGLSLWRGGELEAAQRIFFEGIQWLQKAGHFSDALGLTISQADVQIAQGNLHQAMHTYERALQLETERSTPALRGTADILVEMSELHRERGDLAAAKNDLQRSKDMGEHAGLPQNRYRWRATMALIRASEGDLTGTLDLLDEAEHLYAGDFSPNVCPVPAMKARIWAVQGRFDEAFYWASEQGLSAADELSYLREFEHITLARILLARYRSDRTEQAFQAAVGLLERLLKAAEAGGRTKSAIEIHILLALALYTQSDPNAALLHFQQALAIAEPEGYLRMFVDEGLLMKQLLGEAAARGIMPGYTSRLIAAFEAASPAITHALPVNNMPNDSAFGSTQNMMVEPLSEREIEVLRLFRTELSGPEIAQELVIALSTVRTHTKSIYSKLNVNSRRAAVKRAAELNLI